MPGIGIRAEKARGHRQERDGAGEALESSGHGKRQTSVARKGFGACDAPCEDMANGGDRLDRAGCPAVCDSGSGLARRRGREASFRP